MREWRPRQAGDAGGGCAGAALEEARDLADEAQDELDNERDTTLAEDMYADAVDKTEQANRLENVLKDLEKRASDVDAEATEAERKVAQLPPLRLRSAPMRWTISRIPCRPPMRTRCAAEPCTGGGRR